MAKKIPLLTRLVREYPEYTRDRLTAFVVCRNVYASGELSPDPKKLVDPDCPVSFTFDKYVSRGGFKLERALDAFSIDVKDKVIIDGGSSTGGFTDCLLQRGARYVYSVDVGYNQLDWRLRQDRRVCVMEKTNIMKVSDLDPVPAMGVCDLSFRSISGAASHILSMCTEKRLVSLIKPQFEIPRFVENFNGVVEDDDLLLETMHSVYSNITEEGISILDVVPSPITGHKGNREYLALLGYGESISESVFIDNLAIGKQHESPDGII